jgi:hypothetical protein
VALVEGRSPQRAVGLAILVAGLLLILSVFLEWGHIAIGAEPHSLAQASVSGAGTVAITMPQDDPEFERYAAKSLEHVVSHGGLWVAIIGVLIIAAGAAYLWLPPREEAAIAVALLASIASVLCLASALNVRRIFGDAFDVAAAHYSLGYGLALACITTIVLIALGVAGFALDRQVAR